MPSGRALPLRLPETGTAMLVGDSGMSSGAPAFTAGLEAAGWRVVQRAFPGVGLTTSANVVPDLLNAARGNHVDLTIVSIGGWDRQWLDAHGVAAYRELVDRAFAAFTVARGKVLWLSLLPSDDDENRAVFDPLYEELARHFPATVAYLDIASALRGPSGGYPRTAGKLVLRGRDGYHLCPDGAAAVVHMALRYIGLDRPGWDRQSWRRDPTYETGDACTL